jgi:putative sugar O-methyltransferase
MEVHDFWQQQQKLLAQETDLSTFKTWKVVRSIPLYTQGEYVREYANEVDSMIAMSITRTEWDRVRHALEPKTGHTEESFKGAGGFRLKSMHHVLTFEQMMGKPVTNYENIVEFGAGIGDTAHTIFDYGYEGNYHIVDLPEVQRISKYYLNDFKDNLNFYDAAEELPKLDNALFIATWSFSETPLPYRRIVADIVRNNEMDCFFLFQVNFKEINNIQFFLEQWPAWSNTFYRIRQLSFHMGDGGNFYMVCI